MVQALEQKGQSCGGLECGAARSVPDIPSGEDVSHSCAISLLKVWTECNQHSRAGGKHRWAVGGGREHFTDLAHETSSQNLSLLAGGPAALCL